jgi:hypothetical protein
MAASNTPLHDLIELSALSAFTTYDSSASGGGQILGVVDNATYTDGDASNSATEINELNDQDGGNAGTLTIDGVTYDLQLAVPDGGSNAVSVVVGPAASPTTWVLSGDGGSSFIVFIQAIPQGGGATRYFAAIDDGLGDFPNILSIETRGLDFDPAGDDVMISLDQNNAVAIVCFAQGTCLQTPRGMRPVEALRAGDPLCRWDGDLATALWVGQRPLRALRVSPQHRMLLCSEIALDLFGAPEMLVPAKKLVGHRGVHVDRKTRDLRYWHLLCDRHEVVIAEGAPAETLLMGDVAMRSLAPAQRAEIAATGAQVVAPARPILQRDKDVKRLLSRHVATGCPLIEQSPAAARVPTGAIGARKRAPATKSARTGAMSAQPASSA